MIDWKARAERMEYERNVYHAMLKGMEFKNLDKLPDFGIDAAKEEGAAVASIWTALVADLECAHKLLETAPEVSNNERPARSE